MAEPLFEYRTLLRCSMTGRLFWSCAWGAEARDGTRRWNGWLEFIPIDGGAPASTAHETTQSDRACTLRWAQRLSGAYLEGALGRALKSAPGQAVQFVALPRSKRGPDRRTSKPAASALGTAHAAPAAGPQAGGCNNDVRPAPRAERRPTRRRVPPAARTSQVAEPLETTTPIRVEWPRPLNAWDRWLLKSLGISTQ
jgi:hypothetical protein